MSSNVPRRREFAKKKALLELNMRCIDEGYSFVDPEQGTISVALPRLTRVSPATF
jgi:hypothetical protein